MEVANYVAVLHIWQKTVLVKQGKGSDSPHHGQRTCKLLALCVIAILILVVSSMIDRDGFAHILASFLVYYSEI